MKQLYCKKTPQALEQIREAIKEGDAFRVVNNYETFYGIEFDPWLREGIADLAPNIEVVRMDNNEDYPREYVITPNN